MGYLLLPLTLMVNILAGYASYYYGASVLPYLWIFLSQFLWPGLVYIISWPVAFWVHRMPPVSPPLLASYFEHPASPLMGQIWVGLLLATHLYYIAKHLMRRYNPTHLGVPQMGNPGEDKWELVKRRWSDYASGLARFYDEIKLLHPATFRYTTESFVPMVELRGRELRIREDALRASEVRDLSPELARLLGAYNSHDWLFYDLLDYYPKRLMARHMLLGIGIWIPTLIKVTAWPLLYWRKRVLVYDKLAWICGQGQLLYDELAALPTIRKRPFFSPEPLLQERLGQLEALIRTEHQWMQKHGLIDEGTEPLLLHEPAQGIPQQLAGRQSSSKRKV